MNQKLHDGELKFVSVVWELEPVNSTILTKVCKERLGWSKSTTYTVLKRLSDRGILKNENATVTALVKREDVQRYETEELFGKVFGGSVPAFIAAFLEGKTLTENEVQEIQKMIEDAKQ